MVAKAALFDTNILISALQRGQGRAATALLEPRPAAAAISVITWMEVMVGAPAAREEESRRFLGRFKLVGMEHEVIERAVQIRRSMRLKLPDAIIYAAALATGRTLVTADRGDFAADAPGIELLDLSH